MKHPTETAGAAPTIYDVAKRAGVGIATVSRALNAPATVRPGTLARIYDAVQDLGFVPKAEAAVRARKGTHRVGVVAPFTAYGSFLERLHGVIDAAGENHYEIVVYNQDAAVFRRHFVDSLPLSRRLDGIILMSVPISDRLAQRLLEDGLETVLIELARPEFTSVVIDDEEGGRMAARYLVQRGHRRCAFLGEAPASDAMTSERPGTQNVARLQGFREGLAAAGLDLPDRYVVTTGAPGQVHQAIHRLLDLDPSPTAVFAYSDDLAASTITVACGRGLGVPDDLAVMGFDDREFAGHLGLTTIRQPLQDSGRIALKLLRDRLTGGSPAVVQMVKLPLTIISRTTA